MEFVVTLLVALLIIYGFQKWRKNRRLPPGPRTIPFIGNVTQFNVNDPIPGLTKFGKEFGSIFKINLMGQNIVVVKSLELVRDVLLNKHGKFSGRPEMVKINAYTKHKDVVMTSTGSAWKAKKKAMYTALKMYGEELKKLEMISLECIQEMLTAVQSHNGKPFNPREYIHTAVIEILTILFYGEKLPQKVSKELIEIEEIGQTRHFSTNGVGVELEFFPWLRYLGHPVWKEIQENSSAMIRIYSDMIEKRRSVLKTNEPECVIDGFLQQQDENKALTDDVLPLMLVNLLEAGLFTTKNTMLCFIALMANRPDLQKKLHEEIDSVVGNGTPRLQDKQDMHYTSACMYEITRFTAIVPFLIPHLVTEDHELGSYFLPKGTQIWCNNFDLSHDTNVWEDPWSFKPERFLDEQGHLVAPDHTNRRKIYAFGAGQRLCVGEVLAKNRLFLLIVCLFQKFKFFPVEGKLAPDHDPRSYRYTIVLQPKDYEVTAKERTKGEY